MSYNNYKYWKIHTLKSFPIVSSFGLWSSNGCQMSEIIRHISSVYETSLAANLAPIWITSLSNWGCNLWFLKIFIINFFNSLLPTYNFFSISNITNLSKLETYIMFLINFKFIPLPKDRNVQLCEIGGTTDTENLNVPNLPLFLKI